MKSIPGPSKRKVTEEAEVSKTSPRKKTKASKGKDVVEDPFMTAEELDQDLQRSTEGLTRKWREFESKQLDMLEQVAQRIRELKVLTETTASGATTSSAPVAEKPDTR